MTLRPVWKIHAAIIAASFAADQVKKTALHNPAVWWYKEQRLLISRFAMTQYHYINIMIECRIWYCATLHHRSAWAWLSQTGSSLGGFEYSGAAAEPREGCHPADQRWSQSVTAEVFSLHVKKQNSWNTSVEWKHRYSLLYLFTPQCGYVWVFCLFSSFRQDQQGLARLVERELKRVSQRLDQLSRHHHHQSHTPSPHDDLKVHISKVQTFITCNLS